jgi:hypothetical protein
MLIAYVNIKREQARETHRHAQLLYQVRHAFGGGKEKPPKPDDLIKDEYEP